MNERGFSGTADSGNDGERAERNHQIDILQIVKRRAVQAEKFSGRACGGCWEREFAVRR